MTQGNLGFRGTRKRFIMGVARFLLGLGLLAFSEMKSVAFLVRKLGSFSGQRKDVSHSRGARNAQSGRGRESRRPGCISGFTDKCMQCSRRCLTGVVGTDRNRSRRFKRNLIIET